MPITTTIFSQFAGEVGVIPGLPRINTTATYAQLTADGFLKSPVLNGQTLNNSDIICVNYSGGQGLFQLFNVNQVLTLVPIVGTLVSNTVTITAANLATAGQYTLQASSGSMSFVVKNIRVNYSAAGLSGGGGDRLLIITDGTTTYNNAGITAALLGTPVNTLWGGSGNPIPGTVSMATPTVAGADLYATYSGGATDYSTGSVSITVDILRVA